MVAQKGWVPWTFGEEMMTDSNMKGLIAVQLGIVVCVCVCVCVCVFNPQLFDNTLNQQPMNFHLWAAVPKEHQAVKS
jgi:hypothetical protein